MTAVAEDSARIRYDLVVPTIARPSLLRLLGALGAARGPRPQRVLLCDDRRADGFHFSPITLDGVERDLAGRITILRSHAMGPAFARNVGWNAASSPWVAFLDDDVVPPASWFDDLVRDLAAVEARPDAERVAASYARIEVPLPRDRAPTDWERNVAGLARAEHITADAAFRRAALAAVEGFDPRFPRAYREDTDLALRLRNAGFSLSYGERTTRHPVGPTDPWISVRLQRGNADDAMMAAIHGPAWQGSASDDARRFARHRTIVVAAVDAAAAVVAGRRAEATRHVRTALAGIALFAAERIVPGPRTLAEVRTMLLTSVAIPFAAIAERLRGERAAERLVAPRTRAVLFDRDGTLVHDTPIGGDPSRVAAMPGARAALTRLRNAGVAIAVVTNQPAVGAGDVSTDDLERVHARIERLVGRIDHWAVCPHVPADGCACRKPAPGLVAAAAEALGVPVSACVVVGDIESDLAAAEAAGAGAILVPTHVTRPEEVRAAAVVAPTLERAVDAILRGRL